MKPFPKIMDRRHPATGELIAVKQTPATDRDAAYLQHVRSHPCIKCGSEEGVQAAHVGGLAEGKGKGIKVSDFRCVALCPMCHGLLDRNEWKPATWVLEVWIAELLFEYLGITEVSATRYRGRR